MEQAMVEESTGQAGIGPTDAARGSGDGRSLAAWPQAALAPLLSGLTVCLLLWVASALPALAGPVTIVDDPDVAPAEVEAVHQAVESTLDLFREEFGLTLDHDVRLVLAADKETFIEALMRRSRHSRDAATDRADKSVGMSTKGMIVENLGRQDNVATKIFVAAHELTHQFQDQVSQQHHNAVRWLSEGVANCLAAKVVEQAKLGSMAAFREQWGRQVRSAAQRPRLADLHGAAAWMAAESRYGGDLIYSLGSVAVLDLIELRGERALFAYFSRLRRMDCEQAFQEAFGLDLSQFERQSEQ